MLYSEVIIVCPQIRTKHINTLFGQNGGNLEAESGGTTRFVNGPQFLHILSQMQPIHNIVSYFLKILLAMHGERLPFYSARASSVRIAAVSQ